MAEPTDIDKAKEILFPGLTAEEQDRRMTEAFEAADDVERQQRIDTQVAGSETLKDAIAEANAPRLARIEEYARRDAEITDVLQSAISSDPEFAEKMESIRAEIADRDFPGIDTDPDEYELEVAADEQDVRVDSLGI